MSKGYKQSFTVPIKLEVCVRKVKTYFLNLNQYAKWHFQERNQLKRVFRTLVLKDIKHLQPFKKVHITYKIFYPNNRKFDVDNVGSVVCKFTNDVLTEYNIIEDDNYTCVNGVTYLFGGVDRNNPRCEVLIEEI